MKPIVSRAEWGARPPRRVVRGDLNEPTTGHWNGPKVTVKGRTDWDHDVCPVLLRGIQNFHMDSRGWNDIAYNFVECIHGIIFEGRGLNVWNGANGTNAGNRGSHALMWMAGEGNPFNELEKVGFRECVAWIASRTHAPDAAIGHRDHKSTACPGDERYAWIHAGMPVPQEQPSTNATKEKEMEAAINLIRAYYDKARGTGKGKPKYNPETQDLGGWTYWNEELLKAQDAGKPLKPVTDFCKYLSEKEG